MEAEAEAEAGDGRTPDTGHRTADRGVASATGRTELSNGGSALADRTSHMANRRVTGLHACGDSLECDCECESTHEETRRDG